MSTEDSLLIIIDLLFYIARPLKHYIQVYSWNIQNLFWVHLFLKDNKIYYAML